MRIIRKTALEKLHDCLTQGLSLEDDASHQNAEIMFPDLWDRQKKWKRKTSELVKRNFKEYYPGIEILFSLNVDDYLDEKNPYIIFEEMKRDVYFISKMYLKLRTE